MRGTLAQRLTVVLAGSSHVLPGDRGERDKLDDVDLDLTRTEPVAAALRDAWLLPQSDRERRLGRLAPLAVTVIPRSLINASRRTVWRETGLLQHSPQIDYGLDLDVLTVRRCKHLCLRAERHPEPAVVLVRDASNCLQERDNLAPFDVAVWRMAEDPLDRVAMMAAEVGFHRDPFVSCWSVPAILRT
ncbi:MAG: hypothetical protein ACLP50_28055 [Solirubrobacteraceae bacterium]